MLRISLAASLALLALAGCGEKVAKAEERSARKEIQLTIYKEDFAMVREVRPVALATGRNEIAVQDVSATLDPRSVLFDWKGEGPALVSNTYDVGVANGDALVKRYIGKPVDLVRYSNSGKQADSQHGVLMAAENGNYVIQTEDNFYINPPGAIVAPTENVVTIPRLSVVAESRSDSRADLQVAYLTRGLSWTADYVGIVDPNADKLSLQCWATVENRAGVDFPDAQITLVAGSPNRAAQIADKGRGLFEAGVDVAGFDNDLAKPRAYSINGNIALPQPVGDLQSYPVKNRSSIAQSQLNRLLMLESKNVEAKKDYSVRMPSIAAWDYDYYWPTDRPGHPKITAAFTFFNREKDGLGAPLPGGAMRLYEGTEGSLQYIGGATINDTPVGEKINFTLSNVFDVTATNRITNKQKIGKQIQKTAEVVLRNQKKTAATVRIVQPIGGTWTLSSESEKSAKLDAHNLQWTVTIQPGGETKLKYALLMK